MSIDSRYNGGFEHEEADVTMIAHLLKAAESGQSVIRILTDDTDVFVLLVYCVWKMQLHSAVHMERWNGVVIDINATCVLVVTGFQVSAVARNACHQRLRHRIIPIQQG